MHSFSGLVWTVHLKSYVQVELPLLAGKWNDSVEITAQQQHNDLNFVEKLYKVHRLFCPSLTRKDTRNTEEGRNAINPPVETGIIITLVVDMSVYLSPFLHSQRYTPQGYESHLVHSWITLVPTWSILKLKC